MVELLTNILAHSRIKIIIYNSPKVHYYRIFDYMHPTSTEMSISIFFCFHCKHALKMIQPSPLYKMYREWRPTKITLMHRLAMYVLYMIRNRISSTPNIWCGIYSSYRKLRPCKVSWVTRFSLNLRTSRCYPTNKLNCFLCWMWL